MKSHKCLTALVTIGALLGTASAVHADPYADQTVSIDRGGSADGRYNTDADMVKSSKDRGNEALGAPNWNAFNVWGRATVLGFDPVTGRGGNVVLSFTDNICLDGPGPDIKLYDAFGNQSENGDESAEVEISNDGGLSYVLLADQAVPGSYQLDVGGDLPYFNQVRVTATSTDLWPTISGMDLDAVECLNPVEAPQFDFNLDRCDRLDGVADGDIKSVVAYTQGGMTKVVVEVCGAVSPNSEYKVMFDTVDPNDLDGDGLTDEPDSLLASGQCRAAADATVSFLGGQNSGPGVMTNHGTRLEYEVANVDLPGFVTTDSRVVVWTEVREQGSTVSVASTTTREPTSSKSLSPKAYRKAQQEYRKWLKESLKRANRISRWDPELGDAISDLVQSFHKNDDEDDNDKGSTAPVLAGDNAPNTEAGDGCAAPQLRAEVLEIVIP